MPHNIAEHSQGKQLKLMCELYLNDLSVEENLTRCLIHVIKEVVSMINIGACVHQSCLVRVSCYSNFPIVCDGNVWGTWVVCWSGCTFAQGLQSCQDCHMGCVKRICVFEHSVMTNFNCACPAIQMGQGSGFLSEGSSWLTACMREQRRFWRDCADAQARLNLRCLHRR